MILCDTNILIEFYRNNPDVTAALQRIGLREMAISVITEAELYYGARDKRELRAIRQHLSVISRLELTEAVSRRFMQLMENYSLSHRLTIPDALIAATAIENGITLYTLNTRDFRFIEGLVLFMLTSLSKTNP